MRATICIAAVCAIMLSPSAQRMAAAEVILSTDKSEYEVGEVVHLSAFNAGPEEETLLSYPFFLIWNDDTAQCVHGCLGLPEINAFPAGETITLDWDTGAGPDDPGKHSVRLALNDGPSASYSLGVQVDSGQESWTTMKARYR